MWQALIILILFFILLIISLIFAINRCLKLRDDNKKLESERLKLEKYNRTIEAKLAALHSGDPIDNAIDVLSH